MARLRGKQWFSVTLRFRDLRALATGPEEARVVGMRKGVLGIWTAMVALAILPALLRRVGAFPERSVPVLLYHHLAPESEGKYLDNGAIVPVEEFRQQMEWLREHGYRTITVSELDRFLSRRWGFPPKGVVITFDDGYESVATYAVPILENLGFRASVFVIGSQVGRNTSELSHLSWEEMKTLSGKGVLEFQNHTFAAHYLIDGQHPALTEWPENLIVKDLKDLDNAFAEHGLARPVAVAYPYGAYNDVVVGAVKEAGLKMGFTVERGRVSTNSDRFRLPRMIVFPGTSIEKFAALVRE
ncbi:MAG TPA: polysaccharide deacetylase family protein [Clostridia bacterium]|nr:polysaccharide deacetylase family protein [Clostridia bacterium]